MANKKKEIEKVNLMDPRWTNTPFAFVRLGKSMTLLQQHVLIMVSEHLTQYLDQYFKSGRHLSKKDPNGMITREQALNMPPIMVNYNEFGIDVSNRKELNKAIDEVLDIRTHVLAVKDGVLKEAWLNVFSSVEREAASVSDRQYRTGCFEVRLNPEVAEYATNMKRGYINHPLNVAADSTKIYSPRLYFLIKHNIKRNKTSVDIPFSELRKELGLDVESKDTGEIIDRLYEVYSDFTRYVIDPAVSDINRMASLNLLDITIGNDTSVPYFAVYKNGKTRGEPDSITFNVFLSKLGEFHKDPKKAMEHMQISDLPTATATPIDQPVKRKPGRPRKVQVVSSEEDIFAHPAVEQEAVTVGEKQWRELLQAYGNGPLAERLKNATYKGIELGAFCIEVATYKESNSLIADITQDDVLQTLLNKILPGASPSKLKVGYNH